MAKVSTKLVVGVKAGLGVLTGGRILVSRTLLPGQDGVKAQILHHSVILRQSPQLTAQSYIHAHALPLWGTNGSSSTATEEFQLLE